MANPAINFKTYYCVYVSIMLKLHDGYKNARRFFTHDNAINYDSIVRFTTFGQDYVWKNQIVKIIGKDV